MRRTVRHRLWVGQGIRRGTPRRGIWPFGASIIIFSLFIDRIGYKVAMVYSFVSYLAYTALALAAYHSIHGLTGDALVKAQQHGYQLLYWGSIILGLGNGSVEAYANPMVTTMFSRTRPSG